LPIYLAIILSCANVLQLVHCACRFTATISIAEAGSAVDIKTGSPAFYKDRANLRVAMVRGDLQNLSRLVANM